ncbi:MAG TPA: hypothetical protein VE662_04880 [Solirubrobacterales bacterium]|nr:hypothetical protein [Solirubrobacterales bacterium]
MEGHEGEIDSTGATRFLPPEPPGPEPDLAGPPPQAAPAQQPPPPPPPAPQPTYGYPPPPPGYGYQPSQPPPGYSYPQPYPPQWGYAAPPVPDNGQAVAGFVFSLVAVGLLVISFGLSTIISLGCAITGVVLSRNGKRKVATGQTPKHRGLAQAGFIIGWVGVGLSILATAGWILAIALGAIDESSSGGDPGDVQLSLALLVGS